MKRSYAEPLLASWIQARSSPRNSETRKSARACRGMEEKPKEKAFLDAVDQALADEILPEEEEERLGQLCDFLDVGEEPDAKSSTDSSSRA